MYQIGRLALMLMVPVLFRLGYEAWPGLVEEKTLWGLLTIFGVFWTGVLYIFGRLFELGKVPGLTGRERRRLHDVLSLQRKKVISLGVVCGTCVFLLLMLIISREGMQGLTVAWAVGILIGITAYYLPLIPLWFTEIHNFIDHVTVREERRKEHEQAMKDLQSST